MLEVQNHFLSNYIRREMPRTGFINCIMRMLKSRFNFTVHCALKDYTSYEQDVTTDHFDLPTQEKATNTENSNMTARGRKESRVCVYVATK